MAAELIGFPRHLSQHVGGFIITNERLIKWFQSEMQPWQTALSSNGTSDDPTPLGMLKIDVLALGMLSAIRRSFDLIAAHHGKNFELATVPAEDSNVYDMLCRAEAIGCFRWKAARK